MKATSKAVKESRGRTGTTSTSFAFAPAEKAEVDALAGKLGVSRKEAVLRAVRAYGQAEPSTAELLDIIARRMS